jgi:catechol 2,3-dioxygenase-like lactoylglutathione lyase family enzyme
LKGERWVLAFDDPLSKELSMSQPQLEHLNVTVQDPEATAQMLVDVFGWVIRWSGSSIYEGQTLHVGGEGTYLALFARAEAVPLDGRTYDRHLALNHVGIRVDDLDEIEARVLKAGFETYSHQDYEPGRRFYFRDGGNLEFEVLSYSR